MSQGVLAKNIAEHVAKEAIAHIEECKKLRRNIERLYDFIPFCVHCDGLYYKGDRIVPQGECPLCGLYLHCQYPDCHGIFCKSCESIVCSKCASDCFSMICNDYSLCMKCSNGLICIKCEYTACSKHPLEIAELPNGYKAPLCESCLYWLPQKPREFIYSPQQMIEFYGILHKRQK